MTNVKFCGLRRPCDIEAANLLMPEYIGFVFAPQSKRYITRELALQLKKQLHPAISSVGVFVQENPKKVAAMLNDGIIDLAQLHGNENESYIKNLRELTCKPIIKAFRIDSLQDILEAEASSADFILLDSGTGGTGTTFDWTLLQHIQRPYFLAGGLNLQNISAALQTLKPYAVDVSSGIETHGYKDKEKMREFIRFVRNETGKE